MDDVSTAAAFEALMAYHERTKHHLHRYARSAGYMDWANQPKPFRFYEGAEVELLPFLADDPGAGGNGLYSRHRSPAYPLDRASVAGFLELSLALSAWKSAGGGRWSLRINPSSGNLHPTEAHLVLGPEADRPAGLFHYSPYLHGLERRAELPGPLWDAVQQHLTTDAFLVALTSIFWRESWKYGERAFRYCQHDAGHALAAAGFSASLMGWRITPLTALADDAIERILGFDRTRWPEEEEEHVDLLLAVHPEDRTVPVRDLPASTIAGFSDLPLSGKPSRLSPGRVRWEAVADAARQTRKPPTRPAGRRFAAVGFAPDPGHAMSPAAVIRQRRSALEFDPSFTLSRGHFVAMLDKTRPRPDAPPFDAGFSGTEAHLLIFVHRVADLEPGLYLLVRDPDQEGALRRSLRADFLWREAAPGFPLFFLQPGDFRRTAIRVSCHQEIAGSGAFSLGMIARFAEPLRSSPWRYRALFMETGMIGQVLYLEAEARGARGTGIGCYFDDEVHRIAGIADRSYQSLYHFTVGLPSPDPRLRTDPPYAHLDGAAAPEARRVR